ncbi:enoyl-CoA delta isomerase 1, mitochondrial-like [Chrysoperla carnea]|uniref:enoyl-CoA delta isomerase 1, mitochondrial-like n=1 Tax=Chrysoperla carnea TaxID=189513 RepID=UPI001D091B10|nr:enoyl-CoA delta isomerase 1, mitochondrial-like [Chrysoperla carnea]
MASLRQTLTKFNGFPKLVFETFPRAYSGAASKDLVNVAVNEKSGVATLTLQRLPVNSLNLEFIQAINQSLTELSKSKCRGVILTSASPKVFSAGLDITEMFQPKLDRAKEFWSSLQDLWLNLYGSTLPTAAAIVGHAPAGGCLLSMSCEYRVMAPNCTIGLNETQLGLIAPPWFSDTMLNTIGSRQTEAALTAGRLFTTAEALQIGLIDEIGNSREEIISKCEKFFERFKRISPQARYLSKLATRAKALEDLRTNRQKDLDLFIKTITDPITQKILGMYLQSLKK